MRLVTPTFFIIITAVQLHYFHEDFMKMSDPRNIPTEEVRSQNSSAQGFSDHHDAEEEEEETELESSTKLSKC